MTCKEKLLDPRWQKKRLLILNRDGFACKYCGETKKTLHVHHDSYCGDPWDTPDEDLITCCKDCHFIIEFVKERYSTHQLTAIKSIRHTTDRDLLWFVVVDSKRDPIGVHRLVILFQSSEQDPVFLVNFYSHQIFLLNEMTLDGTFSPQN